MFKVECYAHHTWFCGQIFVTYTVTYTYDRYDYDMRDSIKFSFWTLSHISNKLILKTGNIVLS